MIKIHRFRIKGILFILLLTLCNSYCSAQVGYNGGFEQLDYSGSPRKWITPEVSKYQFGIDTLAKFQGKTAMTIRALPVCSKRSSQVVFQTFYFPKTGRLQDTFHIQYHFKFERGDTSNVYPFLNAFYCNESNGNLKRSQTYQWKPIVTNNDCDKWYQMDLHVITKGGCGETLIGFGVSGIVNILVDSVVIYVNGQILKDELLPELPWYNEDVDLIRRKMVPLNNVDGTTDFSDLSFLRSKLKDVEVVGLGESTHGTHEFFTLRNKLILYLVDSLKFDIIAFENDYPITSQANRLMNSEKYIATKIIDSLFTRIYQTNEMVQLLGELKKRINNKKEIRIEGFDSQDYFYVTTLLTKIFKENDSTLLPQLKEMEDYRNAWYSVGKWDTLSMMAQQLINDFSSKVQLHKKMGVSKEQETLKYLYSFYNAVKIKYETALAFKKMETGEKDMSYQYRDSVMAENILWLRKKYPDKKIIVIAHNAHISKETESSTGKPMGAFLEQSLGKKYVSFGLLTAEGFATGYSQYGNPDVYNLKKPDASSYEYYFSKISVPCYYTELQQAQQASKIFTSLKARNIGFRYNTGDAQFYTQNLSSSYDGVFFIRWSTPANSLYMKP